jgi:hypothetical protein
VLDLRPRISPASSCTLWISRSRGRLIVGAGKEREREQGPLLRRHRPQAGSDLEVGRRAPYLSDHLPTSSIRGRGDLPRFAAAATSSGRREAAFFPNQRMSRTRSALFCFVCSCFALREARS